MKKKERNKKIKELYKNKKTYFEIGKIFNISRQRVHQIITGYKTFSSSSDKKWRKNYREKQRKQIIQHYGGKFPKCVKCGFDNIKCLEIDHINNDGAKQRKKVGGNEELFRWIVKNNFPKDYQLLCRNCNWLKYLKYLTDKKS